MDFPIQQYAGKAVKAKVLISAFGGERGLSYNIQIVDIIKDK
jgi:hypothetical protein